MSAGEATTTEVDNGQNPAIRSGLQSRETEWWGTMFYALSRIEVPEMKGKFTEVVYTTWEEKVQYVKLLNEYREYREKSERHREELEKERASLKREIFELKPKPSLVGLHNYSLQQRLRGQHKAPVPVTPRKRKRRRKQEQEDDDYCYEDDDDADYEDEEDEDYEDDEDGDYEDAEDGDYSGHPNRRVWVGANQCNSNPDLPNREQIKYVLGGSDRGWGSIPSTDPGIERYTYHAFLDIEAHLFSKNPTHGENIAEAVFGFSFADTQVISGCTEFPLFVCGPDIGKTRGQFQYLGNYVARRLSPIAWERLSQLGQEYAVESVHCRGLSKVKLRKLETDTDSPYIRGQFGAGVFRVPCCHLEFRGFDETLDADTRRAPRRIKSR